MAIRNIDNNIYTIPKTIEILDLPITGAYNSSVTCYLSLFNNSVSLSINSFSCTAETNVQFTLLYQVNIHYQILT